MLGVIYKKMHIGVIRPRIRVRNEISRFLEILEFEYFPFGSFGSEPGFWQLLLTAAQSKRAATLVQQAWSGGYKRACEVGGAIFVVMALTPYGGWHGEKDSAESWTRRTTHTGDDVGYYEFDQRFEHPGRTWASATHRAFSFACVGAAMANETWKFVQAKSKQAMKQVLGIRDEKTRMKVTPPLAMAPVTQDEDMRWNPNDDGIVSNP